MSKPANPPEAGPPQLREAVKECAEELRAALAEHGIKLPSLGVDLIAYTSDTPHALVSLGNCRLDTAHRLIDVLRTARPEEPTR